jgi:hypothetical protein
LLSAQIWRVGCQLGVKHFQKLNDKAGQQWSAFFVGPILAILTVNTLF